LSDASPTPDAIADFLEAHRSEAARKVLELYNATTVLLLLGIAGLAIYSFRLGPLVGPGVETSFGLAVAAMFVMGALLVHLVDRTYRSWPLGRKYRPETPTAVTPAGTARLVTWLIVLAAAGGIVYVVAQLLM
jgi:tellurite resistance protein TehA-like permease